MLALLPVLLCMLGRVMQGSSRLSLASLLLAQLPLLLGRGETHPRPSPGWSARARSPVCAGISLSRAVPDEVWVCGHSAGDVGGLPGTRNPACSNLCGLGSGFVPWQQAELSSCWPGFIQLDPLVSEGVPKSFGACGCCVFWVGKLLPQPFL